MASSSADTSGWYSLASRRYARLISSVLAVYDTPRIYGGLAWRGQVSTGVGPGRGVQGGARGQQLGLRGRESCAPSLTL